MLPVSTTIQSKGRILDLSTPVLMGILNATPDSFYNKGRYSDVDALMRNAELMLEQGAAILDIGGASTRPGAEIMSADEELMRVLPAVEAVHNRFPDAWLSVDTYNAPVAKAAVEAGASIVNDVSGARFDGDMLRTVSALKVPYIAMHIQGSPQTMQKDPVYGNVVTEVRDYLQQLCDTCTASGIHDIIVDPGFGFGKTLEHNFELLRSMQTFAILGRPILAGISRKSMICRSLGVTPEQALNGTTALHMVALQQGANILRVHDVKEAREVIELFKWLQK